MKKSDVLRLADNTNTTKLRQLAERAQFKGANEKSFYGVKVPEGFMNSVAFGPMAAADLYARATVFQAAYSQALRGDANFDPATVADPEAKAVEYGTKMASEFSGVTAAEMSNFQASRDVIWRLINMYLTGSTMRGPGMVKSGDLSSPAAFQTVGGYALNVFVKAPYQAYKGKFKPKVPLDALPLFGIPGRAPATQAIRADEATAE